MPHPPQQSPADSSVAVKVDEDAFVLKTDVPDISALVGTIAKLLGSLYSGICSVGGIRGNPYQGPVKGTDRLTGTTQTFGCREYPKRDCRRQSECITGTVITVTQRLPEAISSWGGVAMPSTPDPPGWRWGWAVVNNTVSHTRYTNFELMTPFCTLYHPMTDGTIVSNLNT